jgi:adenylate/nucleoside-diphosphate kinase
VLSLPLPGFLEQSVASVIVEGLKQLIHFKPKYPSLSTKESVLKYLAIYLKGKLQEGIND